MPNPKCNLPVEERERVVNGAKLWLTDEEEQTIRGLMPQYLFFDSVGDRQVFCTACRERFAVKPKDRGKHNSVGTCPRCGSKATWAVVGKYSYQMSTLCSWIKTAVAHPAGDGGLYIIAGEAEREFNWNDLCGEIYWHPWKIYYFRRGAVMMASLRNVYSCWDFSQREQWIGYEERVKDPFPPNMMTYGGYSGDYNILGLEEALEASDFKYCQILPFYEYTYGARLGEMDTARWMVKYLAWYALHPSIEMAVKFGMSDAVVDLIVSGTENKRLLDWDASTPAGFLRMDNQTAKQYLAAGLDFGELKLWRTCCKRLSLEVFLDIVNTIGKGNIQKLTNCAKTAGVTVPKAAKYIQSLMPQCARYSPPADTIIQTWQDYLSMAAKLGYDLSDITVAMPKDLKARHDAAAETLDYQENKEKAKKYKARYKKLQKRYAFELGGLRVVIPKTEREIINEGKTLHHCVGGYAARHMEGRTTILFLRKERTPGRSFLTIELYDDARGKMNIQQIHGYRNEGYGAKVSMRDKYAWLLDPWLEWVNAGSKRDKAGKPVIENKEATA